ncbi:MAG: NgoFVII family restriction endonuclease [Dysgonamonadaceae bacterium]|jgi:hypothetical protein|nr:NgoFVII family restriction endonuclease [Dysgonamonadaceae bacterium]
MLYTENLEEIIFHRHEMFESDEFIVLSGYVGPKPIERLQYLPFHSKIIYGMYGEEGIKRPLHNSLIDIQNAIDSVNIFYSNLPVHSKCYVWRSKGQIVHALIGSANFSKSGLTTPYREILAETTHDTFEPLNKYIQKVLNNSVSCLELDSTQTIEQITTVESECLLSLLGPNGEVQNAAGLNWGQNPANHTNANDSYIKIRTQDIKNYPKLFLPKQVNPTKLDGRGRMRRHNDSIEIIWDDGVCMDGLFFGNQTIDNVIYPKQVGSFAHYAEMGKYLRQRLNVPDGQPVQRLHLDAYGRNTIGVSLLSEGVYKFDFSITGKPKETTGANKEITVLEEEIAEMEAGRQKDATRSAEGRREKKRQRQN